MRCSLIITLAGVCSACGPSTRDLRIRELEEAVQALRAQGEREHQQLQAMSQRVFALSGRVEALRLREASAAPDGLRVVKLDRRAARPESTREVEEAPIDITITGDGDGAANALRVVPTPPAPTPKVSNPRARELFRAGLEAFQAGSARAAAERFGEFVRAFPADPMADNALFWLGECHYELGDFGAAIRDYDGVVHNYAHSSKVPEALLKSGLAHESLGRRADALHRFEELVRRYPGTPVAELARLRMTKKE